MQQTNPGATNRLVRVQTVRGEPFEVRGRRLIPVARVVSLGRARGTVGTHHLGGWGWGLASVKPLSMIVETPSSGYIMTVALRDGTSRALWGLYAAAVGATLLLAAVRWLARKQWPTCTT